MVETDGLENRYAGNGIGGSNPPASALFVSSAPAAHPPPAEILTPTAMGGENQLVRKGLGGSNPPASAS